MIQYIKDGEISPRIITLNNTSIINPTEEQYLEAGFEKIEVNEKVYDEPINLSWETYEHKVQRLIRERYSTSAELAILRQQNEKPEEYQEYYNFCEECKKKAKEE